MWQTSGASGITRFVYDGDRLVEEYDGAGNRPRVYVHGPGVDEPLILYEMTGGPMHRFYHSDHQGSIVALADDYGNALAINGYDEWGIPNAGNQGRFGNPKGGTPKFLGYSLHYNTKTGQISYDRTRTPLPPPAEVKMPGQREMHPRLAWIAGLLALAGAAVLAFTLLWPTLQQQPSHPSAADEDAQVREHLRHEFPVPADFNSAQVRGWKREALKGSPEAAIKLVHAYENCETNNAMAGRAEGRPSSAECLRALDYWVEIAAANGNGEAASMLFNRLSASSSCTDIKRARFWLRKIPGHDQREPWLAAGKELGIKEGRCRQ